MTDSYRPTTDGVVTAVLITRRVLEELGHTVFIIAPDPGPEYREEGVYYFRAIKFRTYAGYYVPIFPSDKTSLIRRLNPDIIHIRGVAFMAEKGLIASHNTGVPTVLTYDTMVTDVIEQYSPIKLPKEVLVKLASIYLRQMLKRPNAVAVPTPSTGRELTEVIGAKPRRLDVIPTGIDTDHFTRSDAGPEIRRRYGIEGKRVMIFVGRLSFEKNVDLVIRSLKLMDDDVVLMVVGQGPVMEDLKAVAESEGVSDRVIFTGYVFDQALVDHYSCADAFVSASVFETQGFTVQEAMSCGLPVACGNGRAFTDFIVDGENGYLFNLSERECADAMRKALDAPPEVLKRSMETAQYYGLKPTTERLVHLYEEVIAAKKAESK
ncbi:MAG: glycosyltransferase [archaeon]|nr:glycosyltransferase [archaeon]